MNLVCRLLLEKKKEVSHETINFVSVHGVALSYTRNDISIMVNETNFGGAGADIDGEDVIPGLINFHVFHTCTSLLMASM